MTIVMGAYCHGVIAFTWVGTWKRNEILLELIYITKA
jgi:hypothetical protein